ncbi:30S ribosomal protein S6 [candidate division KSB1 bacterium]|nr:30S ribosomal protein S6 [candidate division KSB1 bacterium]
MAKYETIFVIDSLLKTDEIENIITKYEKFISANGGKIELIDRWGKKRLAFEIKKRQYGYYVLILFEGLPSMIKSLEREYRLNESILRYKTIKLSTMALKVLSQRAASPKVASDDDTKVVEIEEADKAESDDVSSDDYSNDDVVDDMESENENIANEETQKEN